jgi:ABC-type sugar transport system permease subunit
VVVGLVLALAALYVLLFSYVQPTISTVQTSTRASTFLQDEQGESVGLQNYAEVAQDLAAATRFAQSLALGPLVAIVVVAPLLAFAVHHAGRPTRLGTRLALTIPMVCFAPTAMAAAWRLGLTGEISDWQASYRYIFGLSTFGLVCGLGVTLYLATLRRRKADRPTWPAGIAVGAIAAIAVVAVVLQTFTYTIVLTGGGPDNQTVTPIYTIYTDAFRFFELGVATAAATQVGIGLGVLGIGIALVVILTRMRIEVDPKPDSATPSPNLAAGIFAGVGLLAVLAVAAYGLLPWATRLTQASVEGAPPASTIAINTWVPSLISAAVSVGVAALTALGIGMLRPLGRFSELLLLPFAPWLLVGLGPLGPAAFVAAQERGVLNTFPGLIPPVFLSVPALFVLTVLFRGQELRWRELAASGKSQGSGFMRALAPALPMVGLVGLATWLVQAQSVWWPLLAASEQSLWTGPLWLVQQLGASAANPDAIPIGLPLPVTGLVIFAVVLGIAQVLYLDRLAIRIGRT